MVSRAVVCAVLALAVMLCAGCLSSGGDENELVLATTTSTYDSGLLDDIIGDFEDSFDATVKVIAVGTGQALALGEAGDADVLLVHAPSREIDFVEAGHGTERSLVMYNQFVIVGPASDPAGVTGLNDTDLAMQTFVNMSGSIKFASRGDDSGTHSKEKSLWDMAGYDYDAISSQDNSSWYLSLGQGMGDTLRSADELGAYTLTDEGTFFSMADEVDLVSHVSGDPDLFNQYGVIPVNGSMHDGVDQDLAEDFADWITSEDVQTMIDEYTRDGKQLFTGNAE